ncbi:MAG: prolyl oligopeptidase family serine peptidase [Prevotella sp.]|nr:prolyl oligopeptidase family serine peptidase [Prevotella sp.]
MKKLLLTIATLLACTAHLGVLAQPDTRFAPNKAKRARAEFRKNMPAYAEQMVNDMTFPLAWGRSEVKDFAEWQAAARAKVFECMLEAPPAPAQPVAGMPVPLATERRDGYMAYRLLLPLSRYYDVPALLLVPDGQGPFPAVNVLHDHGAHLFIGKEKMIRPLAAEDSLVRNDADAWADNLYEGQYLGDLLARNGYVVLSADAPMWGERGRAEGTDRQAYDLVAGNMQMYGVDLCGWMHYDDLHATDWLAQLPQVDSTRVGAVGCSMGAYRAWMLAALSDRIRATAAVCWMTTARHQLTLNHGRGENGGFANTLPGLRRWLDYPHVASLACPRAMLFISGRQDKLFAVEGVEQAFATMHDVWQSQQADAELQTELWDIPHSCGLAVQQRVLEFLDEKLKTCR